jgi:hypothetical protein
VRPVVSLLLPPLLQDHLGRVDLVFRPFLRHVSVEEDGLVDVGTFRLRVRVEVGVGCGVVGLRLGLVVR